MAASSNNHAGFQARLDYIRTVLSDYLHFSAKDLEQTNIAPVQYDADFPFKYNNFVYDITLPRDATQSNQPGCVPIPKDTKHLLMRLSNPEAASMHPETRVQNEVAMITLASQALGHFSPSIVPRVFGWGAASHHRLGWILQEFMPGEALAEPFGETMSLEQKKDILTQMAAILKALQDYPLPEGIRGWGGVSFDDKGGIISAPMTSADNNPYLQGWRTNGVRGRIQDFLQRGLPQQFSQMPSKHERAIVHADFTPDNLLYDPASGRITALLDYDFSSIQHPAYEFLRSFGTNGGQLTGWSADPDAAALRSAKLTGQFPSQLPTSKANANGPAIDWELALAWETELQRHQVKRPSTIPGVAGLADVDEVLGMLLPWRLTNEDFLRMNQDERQRKALRRISEEQLASLLEHMGF
ncbi:aph phosphorylate [Fusarium proliferatum]|uniref:Aph phosphorylate n=1 Tax=Gibberella intermedia TaxID=948311 RepID=A0A365N552_GIBIN|nr:aph phosphorylate [Fusarium proliferatum]